MDKVHSDHFVSMVETITFLGMQENHQKPNPKKGSSPNWRTPQPPPKTSDASLPQRGIYKATGFPLLQPWMLTSKVDQGQSPSDSFQGWDEGVLPTVWVDWRWQCLNNPFWAFANQGTGKPLPDLKSHPDSNGFTLRKHLFR